MAPPGISLPFELRARFQVRALLGEGGMGRVVEAFDRRLSRRSPGTGRVPPSGSPEGLRS